MRFRTKKVADNHVRHSYYVTLLRRVGEWLVYHADNVVDKRFDRWA